MNNRLTFILIVLFICFLSAMVGSIVTYSYFLNNIYNLPRFGEIEYKNGSRPGIVIREAKKVVVEQDTQINEIINSTQASIVGIFKKQATTTANPNNQDFNLSKFYYLKNRLGQGLVVTSDGWIMTTFNPYNHKKFNKDDFVKKYVIATKDKIYNIDKVLVDKFSPFIFLHIKAKDLPVKSFADNNDILIGEEVIAVNYDSSVWISYVSYYGTNKDLIKFSDNNNLELKLNSEPNKEFLESFIFDLSGRVVGFIDYDGNIISINGIKSTIKSLLTYQKIKKPSLGVYYINMHDLIKYDGNIQKGALIYNTNKESVVKNSTAYKAGLREGDIILSVNNIYIDKFNDLSSVIQNYLAGDKVNITYRRNSQEYNVDIVLGEQE